MNENFEKLIQRNGAYSLPYLINLHDHSNTISMKYVNNTEDVEYDGETYSAAAFSYTPNKSEYGFDGGGKLEIAVKDTQVIELIDGYRNIELEVIGAINEDGEITEIKTMKHNYGKVSTTREKAVFTFNKDDRLQMTFPTLIWSNMNNRGNS